MAAWNVSGLGTLILIQNITLRWWMVESASRCRGGEEPAQHPIATVQRVIAAMPP